MGFLSLRLVVSLALLAFFVLCSKMSISEIACTYAALILHDDEISVTLEKINTLVKAAKVEVESYWMALFAKLVEKRNVEDLILQIDEW
ncbi:60S acidic ribosomal protein P1 [Vitis vinifera]|uniref:60S acidic ribosomal protein P1 n=1 Tax=Vitis vinifera TaxID=29760 RepID=A0A438FRK5_VITVI|nr:60S acidic ribosomal protein P1 [Vitis vinifera]